MNEKKTGKSKIWLITTSIIAALAVITLGLWLVNNKRGSKEAAMKAVYLENEDGSNLFVEIKSDMIFTGTIPEGEVYGEDGSKITGEELENGDIVEIYGDGIMLESYPGQYPGITKIIRKESKSAEMLKKYDGLLEQFTIKEDPSQLPFLNLEYRQPEASVSASVFTLGGYTWSYEDETGETVGETADSGPVYTWKEYAQMNISGPTDMCLNFSIAPTDITVTRYDAAVKEEEDQSKEYEGESVTIENTTEGPVITAEPGYIYSVKAKWDNGEAEYGFMTTEKQPADSNY